MTLKQLSEHVWIFPHTTTETVIQPNVGVIVDGDQTILVDAGNGAPHAERVKTAVSQQNMPPITQIIYTHHHWDHVFGAHCFDAPIIANQRSVPYLERWRRQPWSDDFLHQWWQRDPVRRKQIAYIGQSAGDWDAFNLRMPTLVFDNNFQLELPTLTVELAHVGGYHAPDSITVHVKEDGVMFVADSYYPPPYYELEPDEEPLMDLEIIDAFMSPEVAIYVDGHNKPFSPKQMAYLVGFQKMKIKAQETQHTL